MRYIAATALLAVIGAPAVARTGPEPPPRGAPVPIVNEGVLGTSYDIEARKMRKQAEHARDSGGMSRSEARRWKRETRRIQGDAARSAVDGFSDVERRSLETRTLLLRGLINAPVNLGR